MSDEVIETAATVHLREDSEGCLWLHVDAPDGKSGLIDLRTLYQHGFGPIVSDIFVKWAEAELREEPPR